MMGFLLPKLLALLGTRAGRIGFLVLLIAGLYFLVRGIVHSNRLNRRPPVISLLESSRDVEELELVSVNSEHVLFFGEPTRREKMAEKAIQDSIRGFQRLQRVLGNMQSAHTGYLKALAAEEADYAALAKLSARRDSALAQLNQIAVPFRKFLTQLQTGDSTSIQTKYGSGIANAWRQYHSASNSGRAQRIAQKALKRAFHTEKAARSAAYDLAQSAREKFTDNPQRRGYQNRLRRLENIYTAQLSDYQRVQAEQAGLRQAAIAADSAAQASFAADNNNFTTDDPKLLAVIPARLTATLNLRNAKFQIDADRVILVHLDSLDFTQVRTDIQNSEYFNAASGGVGNVRNLYGILFLELQWGLREIEYEAMRAAHSPHIRKRSCESAYRYFESLTNPLGYQVRLVFKSGECAEQDPVQPGQPDLRPLPLPQDTILPPPPSDSAGTVTPTPAADPTKRARGIDVSQFQYDIDWAKVKATGVTFGFSEATYGTRYKHATFPPQWQGMKEQGIARGAYHFFLAGTSGVAQAEYFLSEVGEDIGELPPVIDLEGWPTGDPKDPSRGVGAFAYNNTITKADFLREVKAWLNTVEEKTGITPMIYTTDNFGDHYLTDTAFARYPLWIANINGAEEPNLPTAWQGASWWFWQYKQDVPYSGVQSDQQVDLDVYVGDIEDLQKLVAAQKRGE
ncbi:MAG: GH25 family lysozyme [Bacteroidota bacterium]